jgi:hypothetical protein
MDLHLFKIIYVDIDDREAGEQETTWAEKDAETAAYEFTYDASGSGYDVEIISVEKI